MQYKCLYLEYTFIFNVNLNVDILQIFRGFTEYALVESSAPPNPPFLWCLLPITKKTLNNQISGSNNLF